MATLLPDPAYAPVVQSTTRHSNRLLCWCGWFLASIDVEAYRRFVSVIEVRVQPRGQQPRKIRAMMLAAGHSAKMGTTAVQVGRARASRSLPARSGECRTHPDPAMSRFRFRGSTSGCG